MPAFGSASGGARTPALLEVMDAKLRLSLARSYQVPPAFERYPLRAPRYRNWGLETRHGSGDAYPLYTLATMRNLAEHIFDFSNVAAGNEANPTDDEAAAARVQACDLGESRSSICDL